MLGFVVRRLVRALVALLVFQLMLFGLVQAIPGDYATIAGAFGGPGAIAFWRNELGLNQPLAQQFLSWWDRLLHLDLGTSFVYFPTPVAEVMQNNAARTLLLFVSAAILAYAFGIWLGKQVAWRRGGLFEFGAVAGSVAAYSSFAPFLAFLLLNVFAWNLRILPFQHLVNFNVWLQSEITVNQVFLRLVLSVGLVWVSYLAAGTLASRIHRQRLRRSVKVGIPLLALLGFVVFWQRSGHARQALDIAEHLVLPLGTVVLLSFGDTMMTMRATMLEIMGEDHVVTARAKGLSADAIRDRHVARVAILPVLTRLLLSLPFVLVGSIVVERVFFWRAMGEVVFNAVEFQDLPLILGILTVIAVFTLIAHVILDVLYAALDPRLRYA